MRKIAVEKLMQIITVCMLIVYGADLLLTMYADGMALSINTYLEFDRTLIFKGQVWRVLSFIIAYPESSNILFTLMAIYFFYWTGSKVENYWGKARFTLYYLFGIIGTVIAGFIVGQITNVYLNLSLFLAFCTMFPNERVLIFFVIPIKVKWLGIVEAVFIIALFIFGYWAIRASIIAALANYLLFCSYDLINHIKHAIESYKWRKGNGGGGGNNFY